MTNKILLPLSLLLFIATTFAQQPAATDAAAQPATGSPAPAQFAPDTIIPAELGKSLDAKKLKVGDPIEAKTSADMLSNGQIVMPRNTKIVGHVTSVKAHSKDSPDSTIGIAFDRMIMKDGHELPLQASVQAVGAPLSSFGTSSNGGAPDMSGAPVAPVGGGGGSMGGGQRSGGGSSSQPSYPSGGMQTAPDGSPSRSSAAGALGASSQGVVGIKDFSLNATAKESVISSANKNVHLDGGTQLILKVQ